ncbi:MAG: hypothetical protein IPK78_08990 [Rhodospirillales bacterium]|nr:hypothetical protein [Rhodospirillales bacterium]
MRVILVRPMQAVGCPRHVGEGSHASADLSGSLVDTMIPEAFEIARLRRPDHRRRFLCAFTLSKLSG